MHIRKKIDLLRGSGYWMERLHSQLDYLYELIENRQDLSVQTLEDTVSELHARKEENGALLKSDVLEAEQKLLCYSPAAKEYRLHLISHAHIDMDWRWGWEETVAIVIDTFRTMLKLLAEYPSFIFSQSQASTYEIIERYAPEMLEEIRAYVAEGRWELLASTWVENDKNMSGTEAMVRHILYTKQYMQKLFGVDPDHLQVDFEPDTFGHSRMLPEILHQGGVKYYYHCRGCDEEELYRWHAPSGQEILVMRDPQWYYLKETDYHIAWHVPSFCARNHVKSALRCYGVGDHGGGPSRRDIERLLDMQTWPLMPDMQFSTVHRFFKEVEASWDRLPVVGREMNYIFTGCYTAQTRLKQANRQGEDRLMDSEALCAMARAAGCELKGMPSIEPGWRNVLFNQFHDILTGACTREAKEHAIGRFQDACALAMANAKRAMHELGGRIAVDSYTCKTEADSMAEGGGTGFGTWHGNNIRPVFTVNSSGNAGGSVRAYTLFNPTAYDRNELIELTVWDWAAPLEATSIHSHDGKQVEFDILEKDKSYWHHSYCTLSFMAEVPAFGYSNYYVLEEDLPACRIPYFEGPRVHRQSDAPVIMENNCIRAVFRRDTMELISLIDKATGEEQILAPAAYFEWVDEATVMPYSAWTIGQAGKTENLNRNCFVHITEESKYRFSHCVRYELQVQHSKISVLVSLNENSSIIRFSTEIDWHDNGIIEKNTPQLRFCIPYCYDAGEVLYDVPGGCVKRDFSEHDVPALHYAAPVPKSKRSGIVLTSDCKYGYRGTKSMLSMTLLRSSVNPDPYPETGITCAQLGLGIVPEVDWQNLAQLSTKFAHPIYIYSNTLHAGSLPQQDALIKICGRIRLTGAKIAENGKDIVLRFCQSDESVHEARISCARIKAVWRTDILERKQRECMINAGSFELSIPPHGLRSCLVELDD